MKHPVLTVGGFLVSAIFIFMAFILVCSINLIINGYDKEKCGDIPERIWRNAVPFMC